MNKTSAILQLLGFGYGQTELEIPNNANFFIVERKLKITPK
jgi:hypothetical protein